MRGFGGSSGWATSRGGLRARGKLRDETKAGNGGGFAPPTGKCPVPPTSYDGPLGTRAGLMGRFDAHVFQAVVRIELVTYGPRCNRAVKGLGRLFSFLFFEELYRLSLNMIIKAQLILVN